jgi:hypothetical protein
MRNAVRFCVGVGGLDVVFIAVFSEFIRWE